MLFYTVNLYFWIHLSTVVSCQTSSKFGIFFLYEDKDMILYVFSMARNYYDFFLNHYKDLLYVYMFTLKDQAHPPAQKYLGSVLQTVTHELSTYPIQLVNSTDMKPQEF